jgi:hypothetical protein
MGVGSSTTIPTPPTPRLHLPDLRNVALGSPTIRVNGHDIEPGAERDSEFVHGCRLYQGRHSLHGLPEKAWLRQALHNLEARP